MKQRSLLILKNFTREYSGILLGALYALIVRLVFGIDELAPFATLYSITFVWIVPTLIGLIPLFFASEKQLESHTYRVTSPLFTQVIFFILCFLTRIEDIICLLVLLIPFGIGSILVGVFAGAIIKRVKKKRTTLLSILAIPFLLGPLETLIEQPSTSYQGITKVVIDADADLIWKNIVRVSEISDSEYKNGFFNFAGMPRPLFAELSDDTLGAIRTGHFDGGLKFQERVINWDRNQSIAFDITVDSASIRNTVFDQHVLKGNHFKFLNAGYRLQPLPDGRIELSLSSSYQLRTNFNWYGAFCGQILLNDFQQRLLDVIKRRCE